MKKNVLATLSAIVMAAVALSGCELIGGIFKAGVWTGTILVVLIVAIVIWVVSKLFSRNRN
jgi:hypothetical protein